MAEPEDALAEGAACGDQAALAELLNRHGPRVGRKLRRAIPPRFRSVLSIDDVMQDAYTEAFLAMGRFRWRGEGSFAAWLSTLARRSLLDSVRLLEADKRGGERRRLESDSRVGLCEQLGATSTTPSKAAAREERGAAVKAAIEQLPNQYRQVIQMYDLEGRPIEEVASALERSPGAAHMLRLRAHRMLAELMGSGSKYLSKST